MNYYNDIDERACAWTRELISANQIPTGVVDCRSVADIEYDLSKFTQCHFFNGISGWAAALDLAGWSRDRPVWCASLPCQSFSAAGKGEGFEDPRGQLWQPFLGLVRKYRPPAIFGEQVAAAIRFGWLDRVFTDLEEAGYACGAAVLGAHSVGAPHRRQRLYWVAYSQHAERRSLGLNRQDERNGHNAGRAEAHGEPRTRSEVRAGRLGNANGERTGRDTGAGDSAQGGASVRTGGDVPQSSGATGRLGDAESGGRGEQRDASQPGHSGHPERAGGAGLGPERLADPGHESTGRAPGCGEAQSGRPLSDVAGCSPWSAFDLIPCRDGKARRVPKSLFFSVADELSPNLDHLRIARHGHPLTAEKIQGRAALLRGFGNAIVPQVAATFIRASLEALP